MGGRVSNLIMPGFGNPLLPRYSPGWRWDLATELKLELLESVTATGELDLVTLHGVLDIGEGIGVRECPLDCQGKTLELQMGGRGNTARNGLFNFGGTVTAGGEVVCTANCFLACCSLDSASNTATSMASTRFSGNTSSKETREDKGVACNADCIPRWLCHTSLSFEQEM